jgi:hypothetical protein
VGSGAYWNQKESLEQEVETTRQNGLDGQEKKYFKIRLGVSWTSVGTENLPRRQQVVVSRLKMDCINMTHSYRLESNPPPFCEECSTTATIDHILWNYPVFDAARDRNQLEYHKNETSSLFVS